MNDLEEKIYNKIFAATIYEEEIKRQHALAEDLNLGTGEVAEIIEELADELEIYDDDLNPRVEAEKVKTAGDVVDMIKDKLDLFE